jgi:hypothetical protein
MWLKIVNTTSIDLFYFANIYDKFEYLMQIIVNTSKFFQQVVGRLIKNLEKETDQLLK